MHHETQKDVEDTMLQGRVRHRSMARRSDETSQYSRERIKVAKAIARSTESQASSNRGMRSTNGRDILRCSRVRLGILSMGMSGTGICKEGEKAHR